MKRRNIKEGSITYYIEESADGSKYWYLNGKLHRENGPAVEYANEDKLWYIHGTQIHCNNQKEFKLLSIS